MRKATKARTAGEVVPIGFRRELAPHVRIGYLVDFSPDGSPRVDYAGNCSGPLSAVIATSVSDDELRLAVSARREAVLLFDEDDPMKPIVVALVNKTQPCPPRPTDEAAKTQKRIDIRIDDETVSLRAREQISFQCGDASITLRKDGKIVIRGAFVESHATGTNRIKGAAVKIN